jgi:molecular chaperone HtpG
MKAGQTQIFTITGDQAEAMKASPQLEAFKAKDIEVLLLDEPVDEFWPMSATDYDGKPFASATRGDIDLDAMSGEPKADDAEDKKDETPSGDIGALIAMVKLALGDKVKDVRQSKRLTDSVCCLVADEGDLDMRLQKILKAAGQGPGDTARILEINAKHKLIRAMAEKARQDGNSRDVEEMAFLLLDQARIIEGEPPLDGAAFARRMADTMARALG